MTTHNPFTPPKAAAARITAPSKRPPRPISAWLLEALLAFIAVSALVGLWRLVSRIALDPQAVRSVVGAAVGLGFQVGLFVLLALAILGIHRGRRWARWVGLALLVALVAFDLLRADTNDYPNDAQRAGAQIGRYIIIPALCLWWAWAFAFSDKARRFFAHDAPEADAEAVAA